MEKYDTNWYGRTVGGMHDFFGRRRQYASLIHRNIFFELREDAYQLSEKKGDLFHLVVEKLLFIMKMSRLDLDIYVSFLTTRVSKSDVDHWWKLRRTLRFVHCTLKEKRAFGVTNINIIFTWVDE